MSWITNEHCDEVRTTGSAVNLINSFSLIHLITLNLWFPFDFVCQRIEYSQRKKKKKNTKEKNQIDESMIEYKIDSEMD